MKASKRRGLVWGQSWGQSEVGPATLAVYTRRKAMRPTGKHEPFTNNVGRPIPFVTKIRVVDPETRKPLARGKRGLVVIRTKGRCLDYLGESDRHREKDWDGWWNTGDIGTVSRTNALSILDREVDSIPGTSGIELESLLLERLEDATEVIVLGNPGGLPVPVLSTNAGTLDEAEWKRATADLPALEQPRVISWDDFPRTGTWKVRRPTCASRSSEPRRPTAPAGGPEPHPRSPRTRRKARIRQPSHELRRHRRTPARETPTVRKGSNVWHVAPSSPRQ